VVADVTRPAQVDIMKRHDIIYLFSPTWPGLSGLKKDLNILGNDLITHIWVDDEDVVRCFNDEQCIQDDRNPDGMYVNLVFQSFDRFISPSFPDRLGNFLRSPSGAASHTLASGTAVRIRGRSTP
jgi:hypothetical protein